MIKKVKFGTPIIYAILAFLLPTILACIAFARLNAAPFGNMSLLNMDLWGQYFPMYIDQYNHRLNFSFLHSWNGALGFNAFAQSAYYSNSLFLFLFLLFKQANLITVLDIILLSKFGLASLSCFCFLTYKFKKANMITLGISVAYSLCAYMNAFITQPMWTDAVILLPLILLGFERLMQERKPLFYTFCLALVIYSSFYIGFCVCLFLALYFITALISDFEELSFAFVFDKTIHFAGFSILGAGLSAFSLLPIYKAINLTLASEIAKPDKFEFYHPIMDYINNALPFSRISLQYEAANIYCGSFVFLLIILFSLNNNIRLRRRLAFVSLIVLLYFSLNINFLDYIWHGFHIPNQLPGRWSFILSFILLYICYECLIEYKGLDSLRIIAASSLTALIIIIANISSGAFGKNAILAASLTLCLLTIFLLLLLQSRTDHHRILTLFLGAVLIIETGLSFIVVIPRDVAVSAISNYQFADERMRSFVTAYENSGDDFYRMEMYPRWTMNPGMLFAYKGVAYYSSTMTGSAYNFFTAMGLSVYAKNVSTAYIPDYPLLNSIFNIKYLVSRNTNNDVLGFNLIDDNPGFNIMQNQYYLPFAFSVDNQIIEWTPDLIANPFENQNNFIKAAVNGSSDLYIPLALDETSYSNVDLDINEDWLKQFYYKKIQDEPVDFAFNYSLDYSAPVYLVHGFRAGEITVYADGNEIAKTNTQNPVVYLGEIKANSEIIVTVHIENVSIGLWGMKLFTFDEEAFVDCYNQLAGDDVEILYSSDTKIECKINSASGGILYTSIPAEGWSLKLNGNAVQAMKIGDYLLAAPIPEGESLITLNYRVPGLMTGLIISTLCLAALMYLKTRRTW